MLKFYFVLFVMGLVYALLTRNNDDANHVFYFVLPIVLIVGLWLAMKMFDPSDKHDEHKMQPQLEGYGGQVQRHQQPIPHPL